MPGTFGLTSRHNRNRSSGTLLAFALAASAAASAASPLADAIQDGRRASALELIAGDADVDAAQGDGTTPLHWAVYGLDVELVRLLLDRGAQADARNDYGSTPLAEAVKLGDQYLWGRDLLVAPVVERGAASRRSALRTGAGSRSWTGPSASSPN